MKAKVSYKQIQKKQRKIKNQTHKTDIKLHLTFTSVKYVSGKILHIELTLNRYQTLSQKVNLCLMNIH